MNGKCGNPCPHICSRSSTWPGLEARTVPTPCSLPNIVPCTWPVPGFCSLRHLTTFSENTSPTLPQPHPIPSLVQTCNYRTWKAASEIPHRAGQPPAGSQAVSISFYNIPSLWPSCISHSLPPTGGCASQACPSQFWAQSKSKMEPSSPWLASCLPPPWLCRHVRAHKYVSTLPPLYHPPYKQQHVATP